MNTSFELVAYIADNKPQAMKHKMEIEILLLSVLNNRLLRLESLEI